MKQLLFLVLTLLQADLRWISSVTDTHHCKREAHSDEGDYNRYRCPDVAGLEVRIEGSDGREDLVVKQGKQTIRFDYGEQSGELNVKTFSRSTQ